MWVRTLKLLFLISLSCELTAQTTRFGSQIKHTTIAKNLKKKKKKLIAKKLSALAADLIVTNKLLCWHAILRSISILFQNNVLPWSHISYRTKITVRCVVFTPYKTHAHIAQKSYNIISYYILWLLFMTSAVTVSCIFHNSSFLNLRPLFISKLYLYFLFLWVYYFCHLVFNRYHNFLWFLRRIVLFLDIKWGTYLF